LNHNSKIKQKRGFCSDCNDEKEKNIIGGKCSTHYWEETNRKAQLRRDSKATGQHGEKKKTKKINYFSKKMLANLAVYRPLRDKYMKENPICQFKDCNALANDLHHKARRGKNLCNVDTFMGVCRKHHNWIEENPKESKELGYLM